MDASNDGSESVDQFLARIASLNSKQGLEEVERSKKTEEEMIQARRERQARRAERARSLSPSKTGPVPSLRLVGESTPKPTQGIEPPVALTPPVQSQTFERSGSMSPRPDRAAVSGVDFSRPLPPPPASQKLSMPNPPLNATALSRSGTLSWQQRPSSRGPGSIRSRPKSVTSILDVNASAASTPIKNADDMSREDIAATLGAKDPSWFRQTSDRGVGSAAYRKTETDAEIPPSFAGGAMRLPGMSKDLDSSGAEHVAAEPDKPTPPLSPHKLANPMASASPSHSAVLDLPSFKPLDISTTTELDPTGLGRNPSVRSSAGHPPSPTKGLGGFVQSAMMKRSDSVSKRWSVQANAGLKRSDSIASSRPPPSSGASGFTPGQSRASSKDTRGFRDGNSSPLSSSRPVSSHGSDPVPVTKDRILPRAQDGSVDSPTVAPLSGPGDQIKPAETLNQEKTHPTTPPPSESFLSRSPSKTMDPRRWSPTKASWLESALNKPESPRLIPAKSETPTWKLNMQRSKLEQHNQPSETAAVVPANDTVAERPLSSPLKQTTTTTTEVRSYKASDKPTSEKTNLRNTAAEPFPAFDDSTSSVMTQAATEKEGKPAIPSRRNIASAPVGSALKDKSDSELVSSKELTEPKADGKSQVKDIPDSKPDSKPPALKPKPQTPPKTDFRANLKPRQAAPTESNDAEPEFRAVFGKLKRTQTQNYVAPDLFKENITKGKAALNVTGGPQKPKRVDEFKESILQKKDAMKAGGGSTNKRPESISSTDKGVDPVPEALARRMTLHKTGPSIENVDLKKTVEQPSKPTPSTPNVQGRPEKPAHLKRDLPSPPEQKSNTTQKSLPTGREVSETVTARVLPIKPVISAGKPGSHTKSEIEPAGTKSEPVPGADFKGKLPENSKLAARLNPALAGILSRSGSPRLPGESSTNSSAQMPVREVQQSSRDHMNGDPVELTHMTKGRTKGPKRRAPKSGSASKETPQKHVENAEMETDFSATQPKSPSKPASVIADTLPLRLSGPRSPPAKSSTIADDLEQNNNSKPHKWAGGSKVTPMKAQMDAEEQKPAGESHAGTSSAKLEPMREEPVAKPKPMMANKSGELRKVSNQGMTSKGTDNLTSGKPSTPKKFEVLTDRPAFVSSPPESDGERKISSLTPPFASDMPLNPSKSKLNAPKPPKPLPDNSAKPTSVATASKVSGLGLQLGSTSKRTAAVPELTPPPEPEVVAASVAVSPNKISSPTESFPAVKRQLESFFGVLPQARDRAEFDTHAFLSSQNSGAEKPKTLSKQIWEVTGDGKRTAMPPQQEHILFEDRMYLCVHSMESTSGSKSTEVYLWCGDEVSEAAIEDAQLFCRKVARDNGAKSEVVKQGKESSEFFQALGGIVITRKNKSSALYMLCGRRYLGHVAFDEVDLSASSLCSGLPFLISAKFGKLYLWKGAGCNQEDVGCARLIGMDLGLTGEIEEISEGEEPASFWESFPPRPARKESPPTQKNTDPRRGHSPRLYRVEHERPKSAGVFWGLRASSPLKQNHIASVEEISPFCQSDLDATHIHILDTYGELYVLIGASAKKPAEFVTAVNIAQEIAVLSPSVQDRPLLPACYVVLGDPPQNIKAVFRKWRPERVTSQGEQMCARVEEVMQELGMTL
ncbi:uncharacterized protein Z518_10773 [Rhinocladiella mackenziei CBS 650.93]|uniref:DUF4045 domain-containing protein n=1 Tax=Rhinocladiella mackenziei CBS 650.93 TaxID=1442369 RepID=A0A0D2I9A7_9EURO|nr:uncharacterized protein Z518_10773 [Rhinocladiella mackenziei CBS 650.93]KIW99845.1 hypothetical protein Z518_10773 [Rhinocladiella mackenziei CBS 650.93]